MNNEKEYIPYSVRNGITDPFIAKLADHLERVVGWDIESVNMYNGYACIISGKHHLYLYDGVAELIVNGSAKFEMEKEVFEQEYMNLLSYHKK